MKTKDEKILIVYHSIQGHTEKIAVAMTKILDADIKKINKNQESTGTALMRTPRILSQMYGLQSLDTGHIDISDYDKILIGSPCWMYQVTPPVKQFMETNDFSGKQVGLFITHGGDYGQTSEKFEKMIPNSDYMGMLEYQSIDETMISRLENDLKRRFNAK